MSEIIGEVTANMLTQEQRDQQAYEDERRRLFACNASAQVHKRQLTAAYEALDSMSFEHLGDTMYRDYITKAKREIAGALMDFLLSDAYWETRKVALYDMTPKQWVESQQAHPNHTGDCAPSCIAHPSAQ